MPKNENSCFRRKHNQFCYSIFSIKNISENVDSIFFVCKHKRIQISFQKNIIYERKCKVLCFTKCQIEIPTPRYQAIITQVYFIHFYYLYSKIAETKFNHIHLFDNFPSSIRTETIIKHALYTVDKIHD